MASNWTIDDLQMWDAKIQKIAEGFGLSYFPVEFMLCSHTDMLGFMAYNGMPSHYPHWSYGKSYEVQKTQYDYGVSGLPYEMVINSNPALAYLMKDNTLCLQQLTMAHVYGHVDFFTNNFYFKNTQPIDTLANFKVHANRVRKYEQNVNIGQNAVEDVLTAAHGLAFQVNRNYSIKRLSQQKQVARAIDRAKLPNDPYSHIHTTRAVDEPDQYKIPLEPDEDLLLFIRDYNPFMEDWQRDLLTIVWEESQYFVPMMETKIMNEGWASYWHKKIVTELDIAESERIEFAMHNAQVVRPQVGGLNPYHLGYMMWEDIEKRFGREAMFSARETERDTSFLRRFMTKELMLELHLLEYAPEGDEYVVTAVADKDDKHWKKIRDSLVNNTGMSSIPVIKVQDANIKSDQTLDLIHCHDGRDMLKEYMAGTMKHIQKLWGRRVVLRTQINGQKVTVMCNEQNEVSLV